MDNRFNELLAHARQRYDYVILDTPPVLAVTDAVIIGQHAGTVLMISRYAHTCARELEASVERLKQNHINIKGVVLNGMKREANNSYDYYAYDAYHSGNNKIINRSRPSELSDGLRLFKRHKIFFTNAALAPKAVCFKVSPVPIWKRNMKITVIGAGSWGTALALHFAHHNNEVALWTRNPDQIRTLQADRENKRGLPGFPFPESLTVHADLGEALKDSQLA